MTDECSRLCLPQQVSIRLGLCLVCHQLVVTLGEERGLAVMSACLGGTWWVFWLWGLGPMDSATESGARRCGLGQFPGLEGRVR